MEIASRWPFAMPAIVLVLTVFSIGCRESAPRQMSRPPADGTYRGAFVDGDTIQVNVEFTLENGIVTQAYFRHLRADDNYRLDAEHAPYRLVVEQYQEALRHLVGKDLRTHLADLYHPDRIVATEVDGYTSATVRSNKIRSAIQDGLNRGVYSY